MALADKKFVDIHDKIGSDRDKLKDEFDAGYLGRVATTPNEEPFLAGLVYQIGLIQEELDELRRYLTAEVGDGAQGSAGADGRDGTNGTNGTTPTITDLDGDDLPTSSRGLSSGDLYNDRGTVKVA